MSSPPRVWAGPLLICAAVAIGIIGVTAGSWFVVVSMALVVLVQVINLWINRRRLGGGGR